MTTSCIVVLAVLAFGAQAAILCVTLVPVHFEDISCYLDRDHLPHLVELLVTQIRACMHTFMYCALSRCTYAHVFICTLPLIRPRLQALLPRPSLPWSTEPPCALLRPSARALDPLARIASWSEGASPYEGSRSSSSHCIITVASKSLDTFAFLCVFCIFLPSLPINAH